MKTILKKITNRLVYTKVIALSAVFSIAQSTYAANDTILYKKENAGKRQVWANVLQFPHDNYWDDKEWTFIYNQGASKKDKEITHGNMVFVTDNKKRMTIQNDGLIKINEGLTIEKNASVKGDLTIGKFGNNNTPMLFVGSKYVSIGVSNYLNVHQNLQDKFRLFVEKGIVSENFAIINVNDWRDDVLKPDYTLRPLSEVEAFINTNNHLPDVPSEQTIKKEGYEIHEMNKILMQKIEELTLYLIQQQKEIEVLKNRSTQRVEK